MRKKPELLEVHVIPVDRVKDLWGIRTLYDDGIIETEAWGSLDAAVDVAFQRRKDVLKPVR